MEWRRYPADAELTELCETVVRMGRCIRPRHASPFRTLAGTMTERLERLLGARLNLWTVGNYTGAYALEEEVYVQLYGGVHNRP